MSLLEIVAAAGEEILGLRALGGKVSAQGPQVARRVGRGFVRATIVSLIGLAMCWGAARLLPDSGGRAAAAIGVYVALGVALLSVLGWAYVRMVVWNATDQRRPDV